MTNTWPPTLEPLKVDMKVDPGEDRDDDRLKQVLDAAVQFVERVHCGRYNFAGDLGSDLPDPAATTLWLGTLRLAARLDVRRRSPDGSINMQDLGSARVPSFDPDIDRLLRIGRHAVPVVG